jgi:ABC-2 type transport system ATP-binding protein
MFVLAQMKGLSKAEAKKQLEYWFDRLEFKAGGTKNPGTFKGMAQKFSLSFVFCTSLNC